MAEQSITIFNSDVGSVVAIVDKSTQATATLNGPLSVEGWSGFSSFNSILTRCMVSSQGNFQFLHSFGGSIYAYSFGDKIGTIGLSGLAFQKRCGDLDGGIGGTVGIKKALEFYNTNRIAKRESAMTVTFAGTALKGMLTSFTADVANAENLIFQFDMQLALIPDNTSDSLSDAKERGSEEDPYANLTNVPDFNLPPPYDTSETLPNEALFFNQG